MILIFFIFKFEKSPILHNGHVMGWFASSLLWTIIGRVAMFLGFFHKRIFGIYVPQLDNNCHAVLTYSYIDRSWETSLSSSFFQILVSILY